MPSSQLKRAERAIAAIRDQGELPPKTAEALEEIVGAIRSGCLASLESSGCLASLESKGRLWPTAELPSCQIVGANASHAEPGPRETPTMPVLQSDALNAGMDKSNSGSQAVLKEWRGRSFTIGWATAVLVATAGWLYYIARAGWFVVNWFFG
jgi:hypothetical protein